MLLLRLPWLLVHAGQGVSMMLHGSLVYIGSLWNRHKAGTRMHAGQGANGLGKAASTVPYRWTPRIRLHLLWAGRPLRVYSPHLYIAVVLGPYADPMQAPRCPGPLPAPNCVVEHPPLGYTPLGLPSQGGDGAGDVVLLGR